MSTEPALTYLMPVYAGASYLGLLSTENLSTTILPSATFGAAWAAFNIYRSKSLDLGLVTMGIVAVSSAIERGYIGGSGGGLTPTIKLVETIGCALASANFALPIVAWNEVAKVFGRKKTAFWFASFWYYCVGMSIFWAICAYKNHGRTAVAKDDV